MLGAWCFIVKFTTLTLSARASDRILMIDKTIADLAGCDEIRSQHIDEAIQYGSLGLPLLLGINLLYSRWVH